jgi:hypothetical protein
MMNKLCNRIFLGVFVLILIGNIGSSALAATPTPDAEVAESLCYGTMCCGSFTLIAIVAIILVVVLIIAALAYLLMKKK